MFGSVSGMVLILAFTATTAQDPNCNVRADLFFVIDGSDSLSDEDFLASKKFLIEVLREFNIESGKVHFGVNVFGTDVYDRITLHGPDLGTIQKFRDMKKELLEKRIEILRRVRSGTATYKAIKEMRDEFRKNGRSGVTKVGIVITDGKSVNLNATAGQARAAREEGINIIAIGVGDNIFKQELQNIASSPSSIYETLNIMQIVEIIQDAIKEYICIPITTTTEKPTTPESESLKDFDCPDCMIDGTHGYTNHPHSCEKFIQIIANEKGERRYIAKKCRDGLFWDQYLSTCRRPEHVQCEHDPCLTSGVVSYDIEDLCSGYVMCVNKQSWRACCPINHAYVAGKGCVLNPTCMDTCDGDDENHIVHPEVCQKSEHPSDNRYYIQSIEGHTNLTMPCPKGTVFNKDSCDCDLHDTRPRTEKLDDCNPTANFTFDKDFTDSAGGAYAGTQYIKLSEGHAQFTGNGLMNIYRFSMDSFGHNLVIRIRFRPSNPSGKVKQMNQALLTNCISSKGERSSISIRIVRESDITEVVFSTDTIQTTQNVSIPLRNPNGWNTATYMYDGSMLYGIIDDGTGSVMTKSAPLTGDILLRKSGVIVAAGSQLESYTGGVDELQLYKCIPAYVEGYRS